MPGQALEYCAWKLPAGCLWPEGQKRMAGGFLFGSVVRLLLNKFSVILTLPDQGLSYNMRISIG